MKLSLGFRRTTSPAGSMRERVLSSASSSGGSTAASEGAVSSVPSASSSGGYSLFRNQISTKSRFSWASGRSASVGAETRLLEEPPSVRATASKATVLPARARGIRWCDDVRKMYSVGRQVSTGAGERGVVLRFARHRQSNRPVVMKIRRKRLSFATADHEASWRENTRELLENLPGCGFGEIIEVLEDERNYYVVMERVGGTDLFEAAKERTTMDPAEVREVLRQLLAALGELHSRGCIHRDLKLENLMLERLPTSEAATAGGARATADPDFPREHSIESGWSIGSSVSVKVIDFDTVVRYDDSYLAEDPDQKRASLIGSDVLGTNMYLAQETYGGNYSPASDVFAAGVIAYRLLTGRFPFDADIFDDDLGENIVGHPKMREIREKLYNAKVDWSHQVFASEPEARRLLKAMLAAKRQKRPSAEEALQHPWLQDDLISNAPSAGRGLATKAPSCWAGCLNFFREV
eukprot:TRINITY_DN8267_c0_g4_i1.p1 TRINITY_DN8267_c0_g4~~TRINITY_DN8267_c0_g4_i1.p1  ORF type:complete len:506 (-),score=84.51 TRINITY_DN8267_c0_g4_i1:278-1675(-)